jgi:hypothetical protein
VQTMLLMAVRGKYSSERERMIELSLRPVAWEG